MPKKKMPETQKEQSERFKKAVRELIDAGELNPTEAEKRMDEIVREAGWPRATDLGQKPD